MKGHTRWYICSLWMSHHNACCYKITTHTSAHIRLVSYCLIFFPFMLETLDPGAYKSCVTVCFQTLCFHVLFLKGIMKKTLLCHILRICVTICNIKYRIMTEIVSDWYNYINCISTLFLFFHFQIIIALINCWKKPQAADLWLCVFTSDLSATSKQQHNLLEMLILHLLSCCCNTLLWLAWLFQNDETSDVRAYLWITRLSDLHSPSPSSFALCAAAQTWTEIASTPGEAHTLCAPKTYCFVSVAPLQL